MLARIPGLIPLMRRRVTRNPERAARRSIRDPEFRRQTLADPEARPLFEALQSSVLDRLPARLVGTANDTAVLQRLEDLPLARLEAPMLLVHGTADTVVPVAHAERVAAAAPQSRFLRVAGGEHVVLFTHLAELRRAAAEFLAGLGLSSRVDAQARRPGRCRGAAPEDDPSSAPRVSSDGRTSGCRPARSRPVLR